MNTLIDLLKKDSTTPPAELAKMLNQSEEEIRQEIKRLEDEGTILGYQAIVDSSKIESNKVAAIIEIRITPERDGGFNRLAQRISKFDQVISCYLMSGGYDLQVTVEGDNLQDVAGFVSHKLSTLDGVISTATHFRLRTYKENGVLIEAEDSATRLPVSP